MGNLGKHVNRALGGAVSGVPIGIGGSAIGEGLGLFPGQPRGGNVQDITPGQVTAFSEEFRRQREKDRGAGRARGEELFGKEEDIQKERAGRAEDIAGILEQRRQIAEQGFGAPAFQAARESRLRNIGRQEQLAQRNLRGSQGASGVGGPLASAQQAQLFADIDTSRRQAEQSLLLEEVGLKERGIGALEQSVSQEQQRLRQMLLGIAGLEFGEAALGAQERGAAGNILVGREQAAAGAQGANPGLFQSLFGGLFG